MEMDSLAGLGVSVRSQENLESEVIDQLEEQMRLQEKETAVKQVKKEFPLLTQKLKICLKKKRSIETDIKDLHDQNSNQNGHQKRKIMSLIDDQESVQKYLQELLSMQKDLLNRLTQCGYDYKNDPNIKPITVKQEGTCEEDQPRDEEPVEETELQRSIRLGQVTAFGTSVKTTTLEGSSSTFQDYVNDQIEHQAGGLKRKREESPESDSGFIDVPAGPSKTKAPKFGREVPGQHNLSPSSGSDALEVEDPSNAKVKKLKRTRKKEDATGNDGDSDWQPSESEEDNKPLIKISKKKTKSKGKLRPVDSEEELGGWRTDDSDWDGTDDEEEEKKKRVSSSKKDLDDGDKDRYVARLANWQAGRSEDEKKLDGRYEEIEGGLKAPSIIWDRLYDYQKVGVQWMFELHQQHCGGILGDEMGLGKTIQVA